MMTEEIEIKFKVKLTNGFESENILARVYYPNEGNSIIIKKGLNRIELTEAVFHEIGHIIDWYLSDNNQKDSIHIREANADNIEKELMNYHAIKERTI